MRDQLILAWHPEVLQDRQDFLATNRRYVTDLEEICQIVVLRRKRNTAGGRRPSDDFSLAIAHEDRVRDAALYLPIRNRELFDAGIYARMMLRIREHGDWS